MSGSKPILAICGSIRTGSLNRKLLELGVRHLNQGHTVRIVDLSCYDMPIYDGDLESRSGLPEPARELRKLIDESQGLFVCSPEYNGSVTPILKNALDWVSRPFEGDPACKIYRSKVVCLAGVSAGDKAGLRGLAHLSAIFSNMGSIVVPQYFGLGFGSKAFSESGALNDSKMVAAFSTYLTNFEALLQRW